MKMLSIVTSPTVADRCLKKAVDTAGVQLSLHLFAAKIGEAGYVENMNHLLDKVDPEQDEYFVMYNEDCEPWTNNWLAILLKEMEDRKALNVWFAGTSGKSRTYPMNNGRPGDKRKPRLVKHLPSFCLLVKTEALVKLGKLDTDFKHYGSDVHWQWRAAAEFGASSLWVPSVYIAHELHPPRPEWWEQDQVTLSEKWRS